MNTNYSNEDKYLNKIQNILEKSNCKVWREVIPDQHKNKEKEHPYRVDLIFFRDDLNYIGVEGKNINSLRQGSIFAKGILQIQKYRNLTYLNGKIINKWCITAPLKVPLYIDDNNKNSIIEEITYFIKTFLKYMYDICLLELHEYSNNKWDRISIDRLTKGAIHIKQNDIQIAKWWD